MASHGLLKRISSLVICVIISVAFGYGLGSGLKSKSTGVFFEQSVHAQSDNPSAMVNIFVNLSKKMVPSVVNIFTTVSGKTPWGRSAEEDGPGGAPGGPNEMWRRFFEEFFGADPYGGAPDRGPLGRAQSLGSGFIIEVNDGVALILTNNHVVEDADDVKVKFTESTDEKESSAEIVGRDVDLDVALLKVKTRRELVAATLGDSDKLEQGEWVMAVGNPFGHGHSVTTGVVSAKERALPGSYSHYLQVDAPINPGNSGGPLANLNGQVVGINNAIQANAQGIGFAIPINLVKGALPQLKTKGHIERGYIGINIEDLRPELARSLKIDPNIHAPIVTNVIRSAPAEKAGVQAYDVVLEANGKAVHSTTELVGIITNVALGDKVRLKVLRQGKEHDIIVRVAKKPLESGEEKSTRKPKPKAKPQKKKIGLQSGMELQQIDDDIRKDLGLPDKFGGVIVVQVRLGSPADESGLVRGDIILEVDRKPIRSVEDFHAVVKKHSSYLLRIRRQDGRGRENYSVVNLNLSDAAQEDE